jgi:hypothetical protein
MEGRRHWRRRRNEPPTPIQLLLGDPATVHAAADAFGQAEQPEVAAWPFVASVGLRTVTLRWAFGPASSVPEPAAPWRAGRDARVWVADREEIGSGVPVDSAAGAGGALAIGQYEETVVFINTTRAPGPIGVTGGAAAETGLLRELIARQSRSLGAEWLDAADATPGDDGGRRGAWWPMEIEGDAIVLLGLAIARMFTADEARLACELMQRTATEDRRSRTVVVGHEVEPTPPGDAQFEDWLRQVKTAAAPRVEAQPMRAEAVQVPAPTPQQQQQQHLAPTPIPAVSAGAEQAPIPAASAAAEDDLEDWAAGFAVSSADQTARG